MLIVLDNRTKKHRIFVVKDFFFLFLNLICA